MKYSPVISIISGILLTGQVALAEVPLSFTYQGLLKEDGALINATRTLTATLYDEQNNILAQEVKDVLIDSGRYSMTVNNIDVDKIVTADNLYLGIKVGTDEELSPRLLVTSVPYTLAARYADTAGNLLCDGCISASHLDFIASDDFTLPSCPAYQVMTARGDGWVCNDSLEIDNSGSQTVNYFKGKVALNSQKKFLNGLFRYNKYGDSSTTIDTDGILRCPCADASGLVEYQCPDTFSSESDYGPQCFDQYGGAKQLYQRAEWMDSMDEVAVIDGSSLGLGIGLPQAPIHLRTTKGLGKYEMIIADFEPSVLLEDIDGNNFEVGIDNGTMTLSRQDDNGSIVPQITVGDKAVTIKGALTSSSANISGNLTVGSINVGSASIDNSMIAAAAKIDANKLDYPTLQKLVLEMSYPVGAIKITTSNKNPGDYLGGTWVAWGSGKVPVGVNTAETEFNTVEKTGGEKSHTLTTNEMPSHTHPQNSHYHSQPEHSHTVSILNHTGHFGFTDDGADNFWVRAKEVDGVFSTISHSAPHVNSRGTPSDTYIGDQIYMNAAHSVTVGNANPNTNNATATNQYTGGGNAHNNLQPYITCYMWKRTE